jgi:hypothetical protein
MITNLANNTSIPDDEYYDRICQFGKCRDLIFDEADFCEDCGNRIELAIALHGDYGEEDKREAQEAIRASEFYDYKRKTASLRMIYKHYVN